MEQKTERQRAPGARSAEGSDPDPLSTWISQSPDHAYRITYDPRDKSAITVELLTHPKPLSATIYRGEGKTILEAARAALWASKGESP